MPFLNMSGLGQFIVRYLKQTLAHVQRFPANFTTRSALFLGVSAFSNPDNSISVITMVQETANDMSTWSDQVETERETLTEQFVGLAKEVCGR